MTSPYLPNTEADRKAMLGEIGVSSVAELFKDIPEKFRNAHFNLPLPLSELELKEEMRQLSNRNATMDDYACFLGAGYYQHFVPSVISHITGRSEFYTAYTPYQPEIAQGTLQAMFEYQSLIAALTGMDVANASHYDGATAVAEAVNMAYHNFRGRRKKVILSPSVHPQYRDTIHTYMKGMNLEIVGEDLEPEADPDQLISLIDDQTALVLVQYPDFFGRIFDLTKLSEAAHAKKSLLAVHINPVALGLIKPPSDFDADIVTGEGQPLGIPMSFGGPYLGLFATKKQYVRKMAGRLAGETVDTLGQRGYVLTLNTREQHIRRENATSNICTNQGLIALASTVYLSLLGKNGLQELAKLNYHKAHYAAEKFSTVPGFMVNPVQPFFNEFVLHCPLPAAEVNQILLNHDILGGYDLSQDYPDLSHELLVAVTEMNSKSEIDFMVEILEEETHD